MDFIIYAYGGGNILQKVLTGIALVFGSGDYISLLHVTTLFALIVILANAAFNSAKLELNQMVLIFSIFSALIVPKVKVQIKDLTNVGLVSIQTGGNGVEVEEVPIGIALPVSVFSNIGYQMAKLMEQALGDPNSSNQGEDMSYTSTGLLFGQSVIEASSKAAPVSAVAASNFSEFWRMCVFYDILTPREENGYTFDDLMSQRDVIDFLQRRVSKSRAFTFIQSSGVRDLIACRSSIQAGGDLFEQLKTEADKAQGRIGRNLAAKFNPSETSQGNINENAILQNFAASMNLSYSFLTGMAADQSIAMRQTVFSNAMALGFKSFATEAGNDAAVQAYASAVANSQKEALYKQVGQNAKKVLPMLRTFLEVLLYGATPIIFVIAMMPQGFKVLAGYLKCLAWVNVWPLMYAILNFYMNEHTRAAARAIVESGGTATINMLNQNALAVLMSEHSMLAGYFSMSIPIISWGIIHASGSGLAALGSAVGSSFERPAATAITAAQSGNISMGNTSFDNHTQNQVTLSPNTSYGTISSQGMDGVRVMETSHQTVMSIPMNSGPISSNSSLNSSAATSTTIQNAKALTTSAGTSLSSTASQAVEQASNWNHQIQNDSGYSRSEKEAAQKIFNQIRDTSFALQGAVSDTNRKDDSTTAGMKGGLSASIGASAGAGAGAGAGGAGMGVNAKAGLNGDASLGYSSTDSTSTSTANTSSKVDKAAASLSEAASKMAEFNKQHSHKDSTGLGTSVSDKISNLSQQAYQYSQLASKTDSLVKSASETSNQTSGVNVDRTGQYIDQAMKDAGSPTAAAHSIIDAYHGRGDGGAGQFFEGASKPSMSDNEKLKAQILNNSADARISNGEVNASAKPDRKPYLTKVEEENRRTDTGMNEYKKEQEKAASNVQNTDLGALNSDGSFTVSNPQVSGHFKKVEEKMENDSVNHLTKGHPVVRAPGKAWDDTVHGVMEAKRGMMGMADKAASELGKQATQVKDEFNLMLPYKD